MEKRKEILSKLFNKYRNELKELNEYLYNNPELGLQEYKACLAHTDILKKYDFQVEKTFANIETACELLTANTLTSARATSVLTHLIKIRSCCKLMIFIINL